MGFPSRGIRFAHLDPFNKCPCVDESLYSHRDKRWRFADVVGSLHFKSDRTSELNSLKEWSIGYWIGQASSIRISYSQQAFMPAFRSLCNNVGAFFSQAASGLEILSIIRHSSSI